MAATSPIHLHSLPVTFGLSAFVYSGHAVFPSIYRSMKDRSQYPKMLDTTYAIVGVTGALIGEAPSVHCTCPSAAALLIQLKLGRDVSISGQHLLYANVLFFVGQCTIRSLVQVAIVHCLVCMAPYVMQALYWSRLAACSGAAEPAMHSMIRLVELTAPMCKFSDFQSLQLPCHEVQLPQCFTPPTSLYRRS